MITRRLALLILFSATAVFAQEPGLAISTDDLKGQVRSAGWDRVYVRVNGRNVGERRVKLNLFRYDESGRTTEAYTYGNGYRKTIYGYSGGNPTAAVFYFDAVGHAIDDPLKFKAEVDDEEEAGLCPAYSLRREIDKEGGVERLYETCADGSLRASTVTELGVGQELRRMIRTDAKSRSWESVCDYDAAGNMTEFRYTVGRPPAAPYYHTVRYADH